MSGAIRSKVVFVLAAGALALASPASAHASPSVGGFSVRPAEFDPAVPATRAYFKPTIPAGGAYIGKVVVANTAATPLELRVYAVDGLTAVTSGAVYANHEDPVREAGQWVTPNVSTITLAPRSQQLVPFVVEVPSSAPPGDHLAGIAFEDAKPAQKRGSHFAITEIFRMVVGIEVRLPGPAAPAIRLSSATLRALPGTDVGSVVIGLGNAGRSLCKPMLTVALRGSGPPRVVSRRLDTILPGDYIPYPLPWPSALGSGSYHVSVQAAGCGPPATLETAVHSGKTLAGQNRTGAQRPEVRTLIPWWLLLLGGVGGLLSGLAVGLLLFLLLIRRRRREREPDDQPRRRVTASRE
jgi:hypothetical protein